MSVRRTSIWYQDKLNAYLDENYKVHKPVIEMYINSAPNKIAFNIPPLKVRVVLTADDRGRVTEQREPLCGRG